ncbi:MAG: protein kinase [Gemmatimonadaceae bacterium]|nr:protein kinase [Gemmatimonadaceae bacterium]
MPVVPPFQLLDRYDVIEEIGRGGHAVVYRAYDRALTRDVAVKVLREDVLAPTIKARFTQEIQVMATLQHPHILHVHDSGTFEGQPFVVMALAPAQTLAHRLEREPQLPIQDAVQIAREVGSALAHAHARGVLHRDVKPENILLSDGGAILADFGIARVTGELAISRITSTGEAVGTLQYMSPEQLCAEPVDARSDQYALACVLYEMIAGMHPHPAATFEALRALRLMGRQTPLSLLRPSVSPVLEEVVTRAMAVTPADRFRSMDEFLMALDLTRTGDATIVGVTGSGVAIRSDSRGHAAVAAPVRRSGRRAWVAGGVLAMGAAGAALWTSGGVRASPAVTGPTVSLAIEGDSLTRAFSERVQRELSAWDGVTMVPRDGTWRLQATATVLGDSVQLRLEGSGTPLTTGDSGGPATTRLQIAQMLPRVEVATADERTAMMVRHVLAGAPFGEVPGLDGLPGRSLAALRSYVRGHALLRVGQLDSAATSFQVARDAEPRFAQARFWAAQSAAWNSPRVVDRWKGDADEAVRLGTLHGVDSLLAAGLQHMAAARFPEACDAYRRTTGLDAESFSGWFNLGLCQSLDRAVVRDAGNHPQFRGSAWSALKAFSMAVQTAPTSELLARVFGVIRAGTYSTGSELRRGADGATAFAAYPERRGDSLAFVPIDTASLRTGGAALIPTTWTAGLRLGRERAILLAEQWRSRFPGSVQARLVYIESLERAGRLTGDDSVAIHLALGAADSTQRSAADQAQLAIARTRIALRRGDLTGARSAGRAALALVTTVTDTLVRQQLTAVAVLLGDAGALDALAARNTDPGQMPASVATPFRQLESALFLGRCAEAMQRLAQTERALEGALPRSEHAGARLQWIRPLTRWGLPCLGVERAAQYPMQVLLDSAVVLLSRSRPDQSRRLLATIRAQRSGAAVGSITWDYQFPESWLTIAAGDTTAGLNQLVDALNNLATMSAYTLIEPPQAASLRNALQFLAEFPAPRDAQSSLARWRERARGFLTP